MTCFEVLDGLTFDPLNRTDLSNAQEDFGAPFYTVHRVDLHEELMRLTSGLEIRLATKVVGTNGDLTAVKLEDGSEHHADLIIAADGLHSVLRTAVLREEEAASHMKSRMRAFRFMIPTAQLQDDHGFRELVDRKGQGNSVLVDTSATTERHMVWYTCRK
jgi:salicylate hydroxylase